MCKYFDIKKINPRKKVNFTLIRKQTATVNAFLTKATLNRFLKEYPDNSAIADEILRQIAEHNFTCDVDIQFVPYRR